MNLYKAFLSMVLIGIAFGDDAGGIDVIEETTDEDSPETIVGGQQLSQKDRANRPFLVNIGQTDPTLGELFLCGGSVISSRSVLTAAHCVTDGAGNPDDPDWIDFFRYDTTDAIGTNGLVRIPMPAGACVPHPFYNPTTLDNDVAICFLPVPAPAGATPITLNTDPNVPSSTGVPLDVAGWGLRQEDDHPPDWTMDTTVPFVTTLNYLTPLECNPLITTTPAMMCISGVGTQTCHGDSGKPFLMIWMGNQCTHFLTLHFALLIIRGPYRVGKGW
jgi:secreted trypsin-like serine protease